MTFEQYDYVMLKDGALGCLMEDFGDGAYLFEFPTPNGESPYDDRVTHEDEIEKQSRRAPCRTRMLASGILSSYGIG